MVRAPREPAPPARVCMIRLKALGSIELTDEHGTEILSVLAQPKRFALLAYLALDEPAGYHSRDELLAIFWPETDVDRARAALRRALHHLRRSLGDEVLTSRGDEVAVDRNLLRSDVGAFRQAVAEGRWLDAVELYRGDLLKAFHVEDVPDFERWLESTRRHLRAPAASAALEGARVSRGMEDMRRAVSLLRRAAELAAHDEVLVREAATELVGLGDRAGALKMLDELRDRILEELEAEPSAATLELIDRLRDDRAKAPVRAAAPRADPVSRAVRTPRAEDPPRTRTSRAAVVAVAVSVLAIGALGVSRWGHDPARALTELDPAGRRVVMADFESTTDDRALAAALGEAFRTDFQQTREIEVLDRRILRDVLRRMRLDSVEVLSPVLAEEIARREGVPAVLTATFDRVGSSFSLTARVAATLSGRTVAAVRETAADSTELIESVARLSFQLRTEIARMLRDAPPAEPLPTVTTRSLEALEHYAAGVRALATDPTPERSGVHFREAVRLDPEFAMAWRRLGASIGPDSIRIVHERAYQLRDRLTERERLIVEATYRFDQGDEERHLAALQALNEQYPDDLTGLINLANVYRFRGAPEKSVELLRRATAFDPVHRLALINLFLAQAEMGRYEEASSTIDRFVAAYPDDPLAHQSAIQAAVALQEYGRLGRHMADLERSIQLYPRLAIDGHRILSLAAQARGQDSLASHHWSELSRLRGLEISEPDERLSAFRAALDGMGASVFGIYEGPASSLSARLDSLWVASELRGLSADGRAQAHWRAGRAHLTWGSTASARRHLAELRALNADRIAATGRIPAQILEFEAQLAVREARSDDAARLEREQAAAFAEQWGEPCAACVAAQMGLTFEAAAMPDSAIARYERLLEDTPQLLFRADGPPFWDWLSLQLKQAHYRLSVLYEEVGKDAESLMHARLFEELLAEADAPYRPALDANRARIRRLRGAGR